MCSSTPSVVVTGDGWHGRLGGCHHCLHNFNMAAGKKRIRLQRSSLHTPPIRKASAPPLSTALGEREYSSLTFQPAGESPKKDAVVELRGRLRQTKDAPVYLTTSEMVDVAWNLVPEMLRMFCEHWNVFLKSKSVLLWRIFGWSRSSTVSNYCINYLPFSVTSPRPHGTLDNVNRYTHFSW